MISKILFLFSLVAFPLTLFAADSSYEPPKTPVTINDIFYSFAWGQLKGFIPALIAVALVTFLVGVVKYVKSGDNEEQRQSGRNVMIYGIIVLFVMVAFWGIVELVVKSFFIGEVGLPNYLPLSN